jgi:riboflavin kinase/FMN adenylyltransferase
MRNEKAATIGMFDGVHRGHQFVIRQLMEQARQHSLLPLVITFDSSPRQERVLTPLDEKLRLIREVGVEQIEVLSFTQELKALSARQFMQQELRERLGVRLLLTGYDNRFGHNREEGFDDYVGYGRELGIDVIGLPAEGSFSSSNIRQLLTAGQVAEAADCLGRRYTIQGHVGHGQHIGTGLGFPTANLVVDDAQQLIPASGVYAVSVETPGGIYPGMMNIGTRPTFEGHATTLEVHILHYSGNLYGQPLSVSFVSRLREERPFDSPESLVRQLQQDAIQAESIIKEKP